MQQEMRWAGWQWPHHGAVLPVSCGELLKIGGLADLGLERGSAGHIEEGSQGNRPYRRPSKRWGVTH